jgi:glycosyltransferase involved in cell wall biosynthesis
MKRRKPAVSIIIPHYRDVETAAGTIDSLYETIDIDNFEVIVVNDGSGEDFKLPESVIRPNMKYVEHFVNNGVGQAFDTGVSIAKSDNLILMGADIRFEKNGWAKRMIEVTEKNEKAIICTRCGSTKSDREHYGADVIFFVNDDNISKHHPRKNIGGYRSVLEGKWRPRVGRGVYQVPCLMGAFYGVKRAWYKEIRGFELHHLWGVLEPTISLKSWRMGGEVLVDSENSVNHIFNRSPQRQARWDVLMYNQIVLANTVFGIFGAKYAKYLSKGDSVTWNRGADMHTEKQEAVNQLACYIDAKATLSPEELEKKMIELSYYYNQPNCKYENPINE